jgi:hypothetical protein
MAPERVKRTRKGEFLLRLSPSEREALRSAAGLLRQLLTDGDAERDPALQRLFPAAYRDDPEQAREFDAMVHGELLSQRLAAIDTLERTVDAGRVDEGELGAWLAAINDVRLVLGVRLGVTEETSEADFRGDDERAQTFAIYAYLTWLEDDIVRSLSAGLAG